MYRVLYATVAVGVALAWNTAHATLYGVTFSNHQLININQTSGAATLVGTIAETVGSELASFSGNLYAFDQAGSAGSGTFSLINPSTAGTISTTVAGASVVGEGGMSFRSDGVAFLSDSEGTSGRLLQCNVTVNNGCSEIATLSKSLDGLAFNNSNVLYGLSQSPSGDTNPSLYTVDPTTGVETLIGSTGLTGDNLAGLTFDPITQLLYAGIGTNLYTVNISTGAATLIGNTSFGNYAGLAVVNPAPVPVPQPKGVAALFLLATGLAALSLVRQRKIGP